jgi:hypothetical protein
MAGRAQTVLSIVTLAAVAVAFAGVAALAGATSVLEDHVAREDELHRTTNGVHFYDGGYTDDGDLVLLGELPHADFSRGGVYFIGSSELRASIMPPRLPEEERALIHNYALGDLRHREVFHYVRMLVEDEGLIEAGPEKTTVILSLYYPLARLKNPTIPIDRYVETLFERHRFYSYDWDDGITKTSMTGAERFLRIQRDSATRFLRTLITKPSRVRPFPATEEWKRNHLIEVMGSDWRSVMAEETEFVAKTLDYLQERDVRVVALLPPLADLHDELPYDAAYREIIMPMLEARGVPIADFSDFLEDDEFGDDMHARYSGQQRLHEAYRALALDQLEAMGTTLAPPSSS